MTRKVSIIKHGTGEVLPDDSFEPARRGAEASGEVSTDVDGTSDDHDDRTGDRR